MNKYKYQLSNTNANFEKNDEAFGDCQTCSHVVGKTVLTVPLKMEQNSKTACFLLKSNRFPAHLIYTFISKAVSSTLNKI
jgi:hypothetical protein